VHIFNKYQTEGKSKFKRVIESQIKNNALAEKKMAFCFVFWAI
jgi:hypothetical protein